MELTKRANLTQIMKLISVRDFQLHHKQEVIGFVSDAVTNVALHPNQEGTDPAEDHFVTSAVMTVAGKTSNTIELSSEGGTNSSAERQNQEPTDSMTICEIKTGTLMGPYIQTTTKNTFFRKRCCDKTDQKEEKDNFEKPLSKLLFTLINVIGFNQSSHVFFVLLNEMIFYWSGYNQERAGPANDHIVTSAVTTIAGETPNSSERDSEVGNNSTASHHMQRPITSVSKELLCGDSVERVGGHFIMMKAENTRRERNCGKDQEEDLNSLGKPPRK